MILALVMVFQISVAMAVGFVLGRIWQIRCDLEQQRASGFAAPPMKPGGSLRISPSSPISYASPDS